MAMPMWVLAMVLMLESATFVHTQLDTNLISKRGKGIDGSK
jgi:hypothetical protein